MSLDSALNDIRGDVVNLSSEGDTNPSVTIEIATEEAMVDKIQSSCGNITGKDLNKQTIEKFNRLYDQFVIKNNISSIDKLDKNIAIEVFTMLPETNATDIAKLTRAPSVMNKELIDTALKNTADTIPDETINYLNNLAKELDSIHDKSLGVKKGIEIYGSIFRDQLTRLSVNNCYVLCDGNRYDLLGDKFANILSINDKTLDYVKYQGGLVSKYDAIIEKASLNGSFISILNIDNIYEHSLIDIINRLNIASQYVTSGIESITVYEVKLHDFLNSHNYELSPSNADIVNQSEEVVNVLTTINLWNDLFEADGVFDKLKELLVFLD